MKTGDPVEVHEIWASGTGGPHYTWSRGYEFVRETPLPLGRGRGVLVRRTSEGLFKDMEILYDARDVRPATKRDNPEDLLPTWEVRSAEGLEGAYASRESADRAVELQRREFGVRARVVPGPMRPRALVEAVLASDAARRDNPTDLFTPSRYLVLRGATTLVANPVSSSWLWVGAAVALGAVAWLTARKKADTAYWTCRAGHKCVRHADGNIWYDTDVVTKTTTTHTVDPTNLQDLTLVETAPDGRWAEYSLEKPAVLHGPPSVFDF